MGNERVEGQLLQQHIVHFPPYLMQKIFENVKEGIMITNVAGEILAVNAAFEFVTGYTCEEVLGKTPKILQSGVHTKDFYSNMWQSICATGEWQGEIWNRRKTKDIYPEWLNIFRVCSADGEHVYNCAIFTDLSERKHVESELEKRKSMDHLTDVSNRATFMQRLNGLLETSQSLHHVQHAVYFIDLDRFKQLNETLGHVNGDEVLMEIARRLRQTLHNKDSIARYGGDEFVIAVANVMSQHEALLHAENMKHVIEQSIDVGTHEVFVTASIGVSVYPSQASTAEELLHRAEKAMYYAKKQKDNRAVLYFDDLMIDGERVLLLDAELRKAIEQRAFEVHYQPKIDAQTSKLIGFEALVRWKNDALGIVSPAEFIPYAEDTGLIVPISEVIIQKVFEDAKRFSSLGLQSVPIAINISSLHFQHPNFCESLQQLVDEAQVDASHFELEVTERTVMNNAAETVATFHELRKLGFTLSIDDFGTGYSSLSYLVRFPLNTLKIDRSFIQQICMQEEKQAVVDAIIHMSHRLNMRVVAEGVEQLEQVELLRELGCDEIQGFYYSKPLSFEEAVKFAQAAL
ncbi:putative bifunctional diguanylate cyclase/phosphodiesterase [Caryophanon latum]|uniref:Diguanylate cyclase n=1 Tax=Caryophanon latum TaxID=33977 RepID=A0A1C0Z2G9_9BACL|nr:GGDEF domain-containing phosphodiesterase [Caryophanon latum]OCS93540.1 diguanylate cyclase [Caryophanon latum]